MNSVNSSQLPDGFDYYALGHIHFNFEKNIDGKLIVYPGPLFPNNFAEIDELKEGSFCIVNYDGKINVEKRTIALDVESLKIDATDKEPLQITAEIVKKIENLNNKIITLRVFGRLKGNISDIQFVKINEISEGNGCILLKNTSDLENPDLKTDFKIEATDIEEIEKEIIKKFTEENKSDFNSMINLMMKTFNMDKQEGETTASFEKRISQDIEKIIGLK
jgi:DNA repair exonuclease SbcCD nuclease subunit